MIQPSPSDSLVLLTVLSLLHHVCQCTFCIRFHSLWKIMPFHSPLDSQLVLRWTVSLATTCWFSSTSATEQRHTAHGSRLFTDVPLELRTSWLFEVSSRTALFEINRRTARYGRRQFTSSKFARTRELFGTEPTHMFLRETTTPQTEHSWTRWSRDVSAETPVHTARSPSAA